MTEKQRALLKKLEGVYWEIVEECEHDNDFNDELSELKIWTHSIDEMALIIRDKLENE